MKLVRESIAAGSSLIYLITPPPNLASQRRQRFRGKPFVNLLRVYSTRRIHENVECTSVEERERDGDREIERDRERKSDCVPAIRTRDRPIIDVPYRCMAPGITSTKTVPSRISTGTSPQRPLPPFLSTALFARVFPTDRQQPPLWSAPNFSRLFIAGKPFRGKTSIKLVPLERYEALVFDAASVALPFPSLSFTSFFPPSVPPSAVNRERQLVRAFTCDFKIKKKIIYTERRPGSDRAGPVLIPACILGTFDMP